MWTCDGCGEHADDAGYKFCWRCGNPRPETIEMATLQPAGVEAAFGVFLDKKGAETALPARGSRFGAETGPRLPSSLGAFGRNVGQRLKRQAWSKRSKVVSVRVSAEVGRKLESLVRAGVLSSTGEAASYLLDEGIESQAALFARVEQKVAHIERLHAELRNMVTRET